MSRLEAQREEWDLRDGFDPERTVVIREISHSQFLVEEQAQADTQVMPRL
jgi:hypothetical protein